MPAYLFLRRLRRSPAAFFGLIVIALLLLVALFAPWLAPLRSQLAGCRGTPAKPRCPALARHRQLWPRPALSPDLRRAPGAGAGGVSHADYAPRRVCWWGILSGYYGGWLERILMRFTDVVMSMPRLILAFAFVAMLGPGLVNGALALALTTWPAYARQARSEIQRLRHSDYLAAAEMMGIRGWAAADWPYFTAVPAFRHRAPGAGSRRHYSRRRRARFPRSRRASADGGMGGDDRRRNAGYFRSVVDCRRARGGDPDSQPGL